MTEAARPPTGERLIAMEAVNVAYGGVAILRDVTWSVRAGERWVLMGPNGCGKSTLLSLILGDNPQAYGNRIELFGRRRGSGESIWEIKRRIGWVAPELQRHHPPETSLTAAVASGYADSLGLYQRRTPEQLASVRRWLQAVGLAALARSPFSELSSGQQRLALLARALVKEPDLLILDEPCHGLDPPHRQAVLDLLDALAAQRELAMVYVTHRPEERPRTATHVLELAAGRVVRAAPLAAPAPGDRADEHA
jgi:molybdate transport system ATP-binding protein